MTMNKELSLKGALDGRKAQEPGRRSVKGRKQAKVTKEWKRW